MCTTSGSDIQFQMTTTPTTLTAREGDYLQVYFGLQCVFGGLLLLLLLILRYSLYPYQFYAH